jgi:hypothetical protein
MTTTFKVVEFYRNCITNSLNSSTSLANGSLVSSPVKNGFLDEPTSPSARINSLGFNVIGGYLTGIPATVYDLAIGSNGKLIKVGSI